MNRKQHLFIGLIVFVVYTYLLYYIKPIQFDIIFYAGMVTLISSLLPDWIEPAKNWRHRGFGHSKRILRILVLPFLLFTIVVFFLPYSLIISGALIGYMTHLLADSITTVGLPD